MKTLFIALVALVVFVYSLCAAILSIGLERWKAR